MSIRAATRSAVLLVMVTLLVTIVGILPAAANSTPQTLPYSQNWSNTALIALDDNWTNVPGVMGFLGNNLTAVAGADPQTVLVTGDMPDVIANQTDPTLSQGGVAEFQSGNPVVALQGTSTADAPNIIITLTTVGRANIIVSYNLRDLDATADNAIQSVAVQYRIGTTGTFANLPAGFVDDATTGPSEATLVTPVEVGLPPDANDKSIVQVRIITANAIGNDEWVGIDDILIAESTDHAPDVESTTPATDAVDVPVGTNLSVTFTEPVAVATDWYEITCTVTGTHDAVVTGGPTTFTLDPNTDFAHSERCTIRFRAEPVTDTDAVDPPDHMALDRVVTFTMIPPDDAPTVTALDPADGATDVALDTDLDVTFSEPVDVAAGWYAITCGTSGTHAASVTGGPIMFTINPATDFAYAETCTLTIDGSDVTDEDLNDPPNAMSGDTSSSFTTPAPPDTGPTVVATSPANGAADVPVGSTIVVTFSEAVDAAAGWYSIVCDTSGAHPAVVSGGPTDFTLDPDNDFATSETCTLTVHAAQVTDQDADDPPDAMAADVAVSFATVAPPPPPPDAAPSVASTAPADGLTGVALDADVSVTFDEPVDVTGAWYAIHCTVSGAPAVTVTGGPTTYELDPATDLAHGESCTVTIVAANVADQDSNDPPDTMAGDVTFGFATIEAPPHVNAPPTVQAGGPYTVPEGASITLSATGADPDGDPITYAWDLDDNGTFETAGRTASFSAAGMAAPASRTVRVRGMDSGKLDDTDTATVSITFANGGFGPPIGGGSGSVTGKAGATVPVKFSIGGGHGFDILRTGYPASRAYTCGGAVPTDASEPVESVGKGGLKYDAASDTYSFQWKTDKAWKDTCRVLIVGLKDGTNLAVGFQLK